MKTESKITVEYICLKCGALNEIGFNDEIICTFCLYNILYKRKSIRIRRIKAL